jgi:hypothetical protein
MALVVDIMPLNRLRPFPDHLLLASLRALFRETHCHPLLDIHLLLASLLDP